MKRVLLTGGTGFVGQRCLSLLASRGYEVHATHTSSELALDASDGIRWHHVDLLEPDTIPMLIRSVRPSHVLHFAWYAEPGEYLQSHRNTDWVRASIQLMSEFASNGGERFVAAGTCFEYDGRYGYCQEDITPLAPSSLYGHCKNSLRSILQAQAATYDIQFAWGRIFFLYGPHERSRRLVSSVIQSLIQNERAKCSAGTQIRDFMHVHDVSAGFCDLLSSAAAGPVNICSGKAVTISDVVCTIAEQLSCAHLLDLGALPTRSHEPPLLVGNAHRLITEIGFRPQYDLKSGLAHTIKWWRNQLTNQ